MTLDEPLVFAEDKSSELEAGGHIHRPARAAFRQTESGDGELSAENLGNLLRIAHAFDASGNSNTGHTYTMDDPLELGAVP